MPACLAMKHGQVSHFAQFNDIVAPALRMNLIRLSGCRKEDAVPVGADLHFGIGRRSKQQAPRGYRRSVGGWRSRGRPRRKQGCGEQCRAASRDISRKIGLIQAQPLSPRVGDHPCVAKVGAGRQCGFLINSCVRAARQRPGTVAAPLFAADPRVPRARQLRPPTSPRAITCACISAAPSKMLRMRASHSTRLISYSSA